MTPFDLRKEISDPVHAFETGNEGFTDGLSLSRSLILLRH